ncbi:MAG TPA: LysR family transcriptional regulator [Thermoanaerobaculia bacterium]|jgi:DNA-binding transcriptional LysR family regulator|nr:LysR family transcriptional regulator [Thermoanaerobaculia bacterium]
MELDHVEAFVAIVRSGGFSRASASLHLSQPAISRRVHLLERELGAPLFERVHGGALLTDAGRAFLPHAEALLASMRDGVEAVGALRGTSRGNVALAVVGTLASTTLTERLRRFREAHPGVDLRLRTALSAEVSALVLRGDATMGLRYGADPHPDLVSSTIHDEPMVPVCSPRHRLARVRSVAPRALAGERWLAFPPRPGAAREPYSSALEQRLAACGLGAAEIVPIDSLTAQKRMVEAGFGLALLPESSVDEELRAGTLRALRVPALRVTIPVVLIHRRRAFQSGATKALMAMLASWPGATRTPGG